MLKRGGDISWSSFKASQLEWLNFQQIKSVFPREKGVNWNPWHLNDVGSGFDFFFF